MPLHTRPARSYKRRTRIVAAFFALVILAYLVWSAVAVPQATYTARAEALAAPNTGSQSVFAWPSSGQAAIGTKDSGLLASNGAQTAVPIASVAKVMLALSVMRERPFTDGQQGDTLTLTQADVDIYNHYVAEDGSVAKVAAGEQITEYQALQALLLPSANNMADSLAIWAFGSVDSYLAYANNYANQLGLAQTHFADASGFDPGTVSSAVNLLKLGQLALQNDVITDIVQQPRATIPVAGVIHNVNSLLMSGAGFSGIKTGNTDQAGGCLLFSATHTVAGQKITIIGAVLGSQNLQAALRDSATLLASAKQDFVHATIVPKGQVVGTYRTPWGGAVKAVTSADLETVLPKGTSVTSQVALTPIHLPAEQGKEVGEAIAIGLSADDRKAVTVRLAGDLSKPSWWWRLTHPGQVF